MRPGAIMINIAVLHENVLHEDDKLNSHACRKVATAHDLAWPLAKQTTPAPMHAQTGRNNKHACAMHLLRLCRHALQL